MASQLDTLKKTWNLLKHVPGGNVLFSRIVGRTAPYTGTIGATVLTLEKGHARVAMDDKPRLRNHLKSLHAVALANLVELTGNLTLSYSVPEGSRFIVKAMHVEYVKKARGRIVGECQLEVPEVITENVEISVHVVVRDREGDVVVRGRCDSQVGPVPRR